MQSFIIIDRSPGIENWRISLGIKLFTRDFRMSEGLIQVEVVQNNFRREGGGGGKFYPNRPGGSVIKPALLRGIERGLRGELVQKRATSRNPRHRNRPAIDFQKVSAVPGFSVVVAVAGA